MEERRYWCPSCDCWVLARRPRANHVLHLLLSLLLCLLWLPVWLLVATFAGPFLCPVCGSPTRLSEHGPAAEDVFRLSDPRVVGALLLLLLLPAVPVLSVWGLWKLAEGVQFFSR